MAIPTNTRGNTLPITRRIYDIDLSSFRWIHRGFLGMLRLFIVAHSHALRNYAPDFNLEPEKPGFSCMSSRQFDGEKKRLHRLPMVRNIIL